MTIPEAHALAVQHHQAGRLVEAESLYRQILALQPGHAESLHLLGVIAHQRGQHLAALELIGQSLVAHPASASAHCNLGVVHRAIGQDEEAAQCFRRALELDETMANGHQNLAAVLVAQRRFQAGAASARRALAHQPDFASAESILGLALLGLGEAGEALNHLRRATTLDPCSAEFYNNLGNSFMACGSPADAETAYVQALLLQPDYAVPHFNLGHLRFLHGRLPEAVEYFRRALAINPQYAEACGSFCQVLRMLGHTAEAIEHGRKALALKPGLWETYHQLGLALQEVGFHDEMNACYEQAQALLPPADALACHNLGVIRWTQHRLEEAASLFRRAIELEPGLSIARYHLGMARLSCGDMAEGWKEFEWRLRTPLLTAVRQRYAQPQWQGEELAGRTILLEAEQGFGDTFQMWRYIPQIVERGATVIARGPAVLDSLLRPTPGLAQWFNEDESLPPFDSHCPLMSLPLAFGTTSDTIPRTVPYVAAPVEKRINWTGRLARVLEPLKVGVVWSGSLVQRNNRQRALPLSRLLPLLETPGVRFFSLQKGSPALEASAFPSLEDWTAELRDFGDTAALASALDLVITVDTGVAHLVGALGKPVWTLLAFVPDWRWGLEGETCPWYPTMRLFRQRRDGDWADVVQRVAAALAERAAVTRGC
jgi:Flp pilus assembly protein TadD